MKEIKRYEMNHKGLPEPDDKGVLVFHEDHAALQEQLSSYSMSAGQADQRKSESDAVRVALGFSADADDVSPCDLVDAISDLQEQLLALAAENSALKKFCKDAAFDADYSAVLNMEHGGFSDGLNDIKTPTTDAALGEFQAQAVEGFADYIAFYYIGAKQIARYYAAAIRAGEQP
jgi:hypothetical protein